MPRHSQRSRTADVPKLRLLTRRLFEFRLRQWAEQDARLARGLALPAVQRHVGALLCQLEHWAPLIPVAVVEDALHSNDGPMIEIFFRSFLGFSDIGPEHYEALWEILRKESFRRPDRTPENELPYLRTVVSKEAKRRADDRERRDRLWGRLKTPPLPLEEVGSAEKGSAPDPADVFEAKMRAESLIRELMSEDLPTDQRAILESLRDGLSPAEAVKALGRGWGPYIALQSKLQRRARKLLAA